MPRVPTMAQGRGAGKATRCSACAIHQTVDVLPLVPVTAIILSVRDGWSKNSSAIGPLEALMP